MYIECYVNTVCKHVQCRITNNQRWGLDSFSSLAPETIQYTQAWYHYQMWNKKINKYQNLNMHFSWKEKIVVWFEQNDCLNWKPLPSQPLAICFRWAVETTSFKIIHQNLNSVILQTLYIYWHHKAY